MRRHVVGAHWRRSDREPSLSFVLLTLKITSRSFGACPLILEQTRAPSRSPPMKDVKPCRPVKRTRVFRRFFFSTADTLRLRAHVLTPRCLLRCRESGMTV